MRTAHRLDDDAVSRLLQRAEAEVADGRLPACSLALACGNDIVSATFGAPEDSRFLLFSLTKSLVAGALWVLFGDGAVNPQTRVVEVVPEFGTNGKDGVTLEHLLIHTGGFPRAPLRPEDGATSAGRVQAFAQWRLDWEPGTRTEYHPTSAHWVLAEVVERISGQDYRRFVAERVVAPLGLGSLVLGVREADQSDIVDACVLGEDDDVPADRTTSAYVAETATRLLLRFNEPHIRAIGVPGAGAVGSAADLAQYFSALLHNPGDLWDPEILRDGTSVVRNTLPDPPTNVPANRTLGLKVAGDDGKALFREFGRDVSPRAFICSGAGGQVVWADPDTGLSFCFLTSGINVDVVTSFTRSTDLSSLAALCVRPV